MKKQKKASRKPRRENEKKPVRKGVKSMKGQGEMHDECKKCFSFCLTPTAKKGIEHLSEKANLSQSELIEQLVRHLLIITELHSQVIQTLAGS
jgi:predicted adenine nucleotide alpha hydrolase (AANH) superfamily ATPase